MAVSIILGGPFCGRPYTKSPASSIAASHFCLKTGRMSSEGSSVVWYRGATAPCRMKLSTPVGAAKDEQPRDGRDDPLPMRPSWWEMSKLKLSELPETRPLVVGIIQDPQDYPWGTVGQDGKRHFRDYEFDRP